MIYRQYLWLVGLCILCTLPLLQAKAEEAPQQIESVGNLPSFGFDDNFPNLIDAEMDIHYSAPGDICIMLELFNIKGERVSMLVDAVQSAGSHAIPWNGLDSFGEPVPKGVYFFRLKAGIYSEIRKVLVIRDLR